MVRTTLLFVFVTAGLVLWRVLAGWIVSFMIQVTSFEFTMGVGACGFLLCAAVLFNYYVLQRR